MSLQNRISATHNQLVTYSPVVSPRRMSAACRFTFAMQYRNFTSVFCQSDRFLFQLCVIYSSATRLLHPSIVPLPFSSRRVISGADYGTMLRRARLIRLENKPGVYHARCASGSGEISRILRSWRTTRRLTAIIIRASLPPLRNGSRVYV